MTPIHPSVVIGSPFPPALQQLEYWGNAFDYLLSNKFKIYPLS